VAPEIHTPKGIYLALIPDYGVHQILVALDIHLVNGLDNDIDYHYELELRRNVEEAYEGTIEGGDLVHMGSIYFEQLNESPEIFVELDFKEHGKAVKVERSVKLKPQAIHKGPKFCQLINENAFWYELHIQKAAAAIMPKPAAPKTKLQVDADMLKHFMTENSTGGKGKFDLSEPDPEIDLHFDMLVKDETGWSAGEKLNLQLETFNKRLESAIANGLHSMVVIHGVGTGRLKKEIIEILKQHPKVRSYGPSFERKYGFGATEIFF
jgi:hypothetical protein